MKKLQLIILSGVMFVSILGVKSYAESKSYEDPNYMDQQMNYKIEKLDSDNDIERNNEYYNRRYNNMMGRDGRHCYEYYEEERNNNYNKNSYSDKNAEQTYGEL